MNKKHLTIIIHVLSWLAFFTVFFLFFNIYNTIEPANFTIFNYLHNPKPQSIITFFLLKISFLIFFFYLNLFLLLPKLYYVQKRITYFFVVLAFLIVGIYFSSFIRNEFITPALNLTNAGVPFNHTNSDYIFTFYNFLIVWFLSIIINLADRFRNIEQKNKEMKVQKLHAELSYLKAQINPHFLFNTLNNIYALSICKNEQTPEAILKLSAIMRYVTEEANLKTVPLKKELEFLQNYISLQKLRNDDKLSVEFTINGESGRNVIAPLLLINFIENAFKYGVSNHIPCYVNICINLTDHQLSLTVINKIMGTVVKQSTFTGINNALKRLQLLYSHKHTLTIVEIDNLYKVFLQLDLT